MSPSSSVYMSFPQGVVDNFGASVDNYFYPQISKVFHRFSTELSTGKVT